MRTISSQQLDDLTRRAENGDRRRANLNMHPDLGDPYQRFFNAMEPSTYVRPHRHPNQARWELFVLLRGSALVLEMTGDGTISDRTVLGVTQSVAVEIAGGCWHTVVALEHETLLFEVKPGPYRPVEDKDFMTWAPSEGDASTPTMLKRMRSARVGDSIHPEVS